MKMKKEIANKAALARDVFQIRTKWNRKQDFVVVGEMNGKNIQMKAKTQKGVEDIVANVTTKFFISQWNVVNVNGAIIGYRHNLIASRVIRNAPHLRRQRKSVVNQTRRQ